MTWSILLPSGEYLDTPIDFELSFELNNQVFSTSDSTILPGSFSYPVEVPLTARMKALLGFPHRIDRVGSFIVIENIWACAGAHRLISGTLKITRAVNSRVSIVIYSDILGALKKASLPELDYGIDISVGGTSSATWAAHMLDTADNPEAYNHAFFPIYYTGGDKGWINKWDPALGTFIPNSSEAIAPFVKISYILERIFSNADGYTLDNAWQRDIEMTRRYVFHQSDVRKIATNIFLDPTYPDGYNLQKHVPKVAVTKFLRTICAQNCLGLFTNNFNRTVRIASLESAIRGGSSQNWTEYALNNPIIEPNDSPPEYLNYEQPYSGVPDHFPAPESVEKIYNTGADFNDDWQNLPTGYSYVEGVSTLMEVKDEGIVVTLQRGHALFRGVGDSSGTRIDIGLVPFRAVEFGDEGTYSVFWEGEPSRYENSGSGYVWQQKDCPLTVLQYRGIQEQKSGEPPAPLACNHVWQAYNSVVGTRSKIVAGGVDLADSAHSLNFAGEYGLYEQAWATWFNMLNSGKNVTQSFILPITTLTEFSFEEKIRVGNLDFFAKRLKIQKLLDRGRVLIEASLISVI